MARANSPRPAPWCASAGVRTSASRTITRANPRGTQPDSPAGRRTHRTQAVPGWRVGAPVATSAQIGGQTVFPRLPIEGSWLPPDWEGIHRAGVIHALRVRHDCAGVGRRGSARAVPLGVHERNNR